jgi:hypothetical protein
LSPEFLEGIVMTSLRVFSLLLVGVSAISLLIAGCGAVFINQGSRNDSYADGIINPNMPRKTDIPQENRIISDFEDGTKTMNPELYGSGLGFWTAAASDNSVFINNFISNGGANGSTRAAHISGMLVDRGDAKYPTLALEGKFKKNGTYDVSPFRGVQFYYRSADRAGRRRFEIGIASTVPVSDGGVCVEQCGNHFGANLSASSDWVEVSYSFDQLKREEGWGATLNSDDFVDHRKEVIYLKWENGTNNIPGMYNIDYWVDDVQFY